MRKLFAVALTGEIDLFLLEKYGFNLDKIESEMRKAAKELDFERAMELRDIWLEMKSE